MEKVNKTTFEGSGGVDPMDVFEIKLKVELDQIGQSIGKEFLEYNKLLTQSQNIIMAVARHLAIPPKRMAELIYDGKNNKSYEMTIVEELRKIQS